MPQEATAGVRYPRQVRSDEIESDPADSLAASANGTGAVTDEVVCPHFHRAIELVGRRWSGAIVYSLFDGPRYFRQIAAAVPGVSDRLLAERLKELESEGLVERSVHDGPPTRVSYGLTEAGRELEPMLSSLCDWARRRLPCDNGRSA